MSKAGGSFGGSESAASSGDMDGTTRKRRKRRVTEMIKKGTDPVQDPLNRLEMIRLRQFFGTPDKQIRKKTK